MINTNQDAIDKHISCILDGSRGIYLPQAFAENFNLEEWISDEGKREEYKRVLLPGPKGGLFSIDSADADDDSLDLYSEVWEELLDNAVYTDEHGMRWYLYQDADLFMVSEKFNVEAWGVEELGEDDEPEEQA